MLNTVNTLKRAILMFPFGIIGLMLFIRAGLDYVHYMEVSVGVDAVTRATKGGSSEWVQDAQLWTFARQNFWLDIFAVATEPRNLVQIGLLSLAISIAITAIGSLAERSAKSGA